MANTDLGAFAGSLVPSGASLTNFFTWFGLGVVVAGLIATIIYLHLQKKKFNKSILIFRKIAGEPQWTDTFRAKSERIGMAGDYWFRCKNGKILARPKFEIRPNTFLYYEGADGELRNFKLGDIDEVLKKAGVVILQEDMRLTRLAIEKNLNARLQKKSWWEENKAFVTNLILIFVVIVALMVVLSQIKDLIKELGVLANVLAEALKVANAKGIDIANGVQL